MAQQGRLQQDQKYIIIAQYAATGRKIDSARAAQVSWGRVLTEMKRDPDFAEAITDAYAAYRDSLEREVHRRGVVGWMEPVFQGGRQVGEIRKFDSTLLLSHIKRHIPEYRERYAIKLDVSGQVLVVPGLPGAAALPATEAEWEQISNVRAQLPGGNGNGQ